jgi:hypothetical protein
MVPFLVIVQPIWIKSAGEMLSKTRTSAGEVRKVPLRGQWSSGRLEPAHAQDGSVQAMHCRRGWFEATISDCDLDGKSTKRL